VAVMKGVWFWKGKRALHIGGLFGAEIHWNAELSKGITSRRWYRA
jgi:hypothetical protein